jgi:hypothetical protein
MIINIYINSREKQNKKTACMIIKITHAAILKYIKYHL